MRKSFRAVLLTALVSSAAFIVPHSAAAECGIDAGRISIVGNEFPAIQSVARKAAECATGSVSLRSNLTADHQRINLPGMQGNPAEYTSAIVATSSIVALLNADVIRPLDDLIAEHGQDIPRERLITIDGEVMAVAFMANAQHLIYRSDLLEEVGAEPPSTYEELLDAAEKIRAAGIMEYPVAGAYAAGWNLAQEFINMYTGMGGEFFEPGTANVAINNEQGIATLEMMKALSEYMDPDFLTYTSNVLISEWKSGNIALMNAWGSSAGALMDAEGSTPQVYENTVAAGPMTVNGGDVPATTLWWDGWTVARNISDEDAVATFVAMAHATSPGLLDEETMEQAVWMIEGYTPSAASEGVIATMAAGTRPYPMLPYMGLLHTALGDNIADFLNGREDAAAALADIEAAYNAAAREQGFIQ